MRYEEKNREKEVKNKAVTDELMQFAKNDKANDKADKTKVDISTKKTAPTTPTNVTKISKNPDLDTDDEEDELDKDPKFFNTDHWKRVKATEVVSKKKEVALDSDPFLEIEKKHSANPTSVDKKETNSEKQGKSTKEATENVPSSKELNTTDAWNNRIDNSRSSVPKGKKSKGEKSRKVIHDFGPPSCCTAIVCTISNIFGALRRIVLLLFLFVLIIWSACWLYRRYINDGTNSSTHNKSKHFNKKGRKHKNQNSSHTFGVTDFLRDASAHYMGVGRKSDVSSAVSE